MLRHECHLYAVYRLNRVGYVLRPSLSVPKVVSFSRRVSTAEVRDLKTIAVLLQAWIEPRREPLQVP